MAIATNAAEEVAVDAPAETSVLVLPPTFAHLGPGDVIAVNKNDSRVRVLYRHSSHHNSFLVTERCDHYCLMCSQPPRDIDDSWIVEEILEALPLLNPDAREIGFSGGEPTLLGDRLIEILVACRDQLPRTAVHVLSNGRRFSDKDFARAWAGIEHPDLMVGIPLYSDVSSVHDYVVQSDGAFDATVRGILNLKELGQRVELRIVLHKQTVPSLARFAEFIARNLLFLDHVALMGLEVTGFTRANLPILWVDPYDYQNDLAQAVFILAGAGIRVSVYNHPLCVIPERIWPYAVKSISDWKNAFHEECDVCIVREACGGFFATSKGRCSDHIRAFRAIGGKAKEALAANGQARAE